MFAAGFTKVVPFDDGSDGMKNGSPKFKMKCGPKMQEGCLHSANLWNVPSDAD